MSNFIGWKKCGYSDEDEDKTLSMQIMHSMAKSEEIADTAVFLGHLCRRLSLDR